MAIATISKMEWGYSITGDVDATTVSAGTLIIKSIGFSGNADAATAVMTCNDLSGAATSFMKFASNDTNELNSASGNYIYFGESGVSVTNLILTLGNGGSHIYIYLA